MVVFSLLRGCSSNRDIKKLEAQVKINADSIRQRKLIDSLQIEDIRKQDTEIERIKAENSLRNAEDERESEDVKVTRKKSENEFQVVVKKNRDIDNEIRNAPNNNVRRVLADSVRARAKRQGSH